MFLFNLWSFSCPTIIWIQSFLNVFVQEDDAVVVWGRLQGRYPDLQPHQGWLVPEDTRVSLTPKLSSDQCCWCGTVSKMTPPKQGCGWALCFHVYRRAVVQVQVNLQPTLRGTFWSIWPHTVRQSLRSGSNGLKSTTCQRPGEHEVSQTVCSVICHSFIVVVHKMKGPRLCLCQNLHFYTQLHLLGSFFFKAGSTVISSSVYLVGSTPGRYVGSDMERWGHLRLRKVNAPAKLIHMWGRHSHLSNSSF